MKLDIIKSKFLFLASALLLGTVGVIRRYVVFSSATIALARGFIGTLFLLLFMVCTKKKIDFITVRKKIVWLLVSGVLLSANWILLLEAYKCVDISVATIFSYLAPIFVVIVSTIILKEAASLKKIICVIVAVIGIIPVSGIFDAGEKSASNFTGILCALGSAVVYSCVVLINKNLTDVDSYDKTVVQLATSCVVLIPYVLFTKDLTYIKSCLNKDFFSSPEIILSIIMLSVLGVVHTGLTYTMYFSSLKNLDAQTIAIYSYIDPIVAILLSTILLGETMTVLKIIGAVLVLGATLVSELHFKKKVKPI